MFTLFNCIIVTFFIVTIGQTNLRYHIVKHLDIDSSCAPMGTETVEKKLRCAHTCFNQLAPQCNAFIYEQLAGLCTMYEINNCNLTSNYDQSGMSFFSISALLIQYKILIGLLVGWRGEWQSQLDCPIGTAVGLFSVAADRWNGVGFGSDDVGLTEIHIGCTSYDGTLAQILKTQDPEVPSSADPIQEGNYTCTGNSHMNAFRYSNQNEERGSFDDEGTLSFDMRCDDADSTTFESIAGRERATAEMTFSKWSICDEGYVLSGIRIRLDIVDDGDRTSINEVSGACRILLPEGYYT